MRALNLIYFTFLLVSLIGCRNEIKSIDYELTSSKIESKKDSVIYKNISDFLQTNQSAIIRNYYFLCDSSQIHTFREYNVNHKLENIKIRLGKESVRISPIPSSYRVSEGPIAEYKIRNDSLGQLASYFIDVDLKPDLSISEFTATLRFMKDSNGIDKVSFVKEISSSENYLIQDKLSKNSW